MCQNTSRVANLYLFIYFLNVTRVKLAHRMLPTCIKSGVCALFVYICAGNHFRNKDTLASNQLWVTIPHLYQNYRRIAGIVVPRLERQYEHICTIMCHVTKIYLFHMWFTQHSSFRVPLNVISAISAYQSLHKQTQFFLFVCFNIRSASFTEVWKLYIIIITKPKLWKFRIERSIQA